MQVAQTVTERFADQAMAWALLSCIFRDSSEDPEHTTHARNAAHRASQLATDKQAGGQGDQHAPGNPFQQLELLLLDMHLGTLAQQVHQQATTGERTSDADTMATLCEAQAASLTGNVTTAVKLLAAVAKRSGERLDESMACH